MSLVVVYTKDTLVFYMLCMMYGHVAMFKIGRWAKNKMKQVHLAVDSCSSSYFSASIKLIFQNIASSHMHTSCKTIAIFWLLHCIEYDHNTRVEIGRWSKNQKKQDQSVLYSHSSTYFMKDIIHLTIYCWWSCTEMSISPCPRCLWFSVWNLAMIPLSK